MKIFMKAISLVLAVLIITSSLAVMSVVSFSAETEGQYIYCDTTNFNKHNDLYCHIYEYNGDFFFMWKSNGEICEKIGDNLFRYDLSKLNNSEKFPQGLDDSKSYVIIFSNDAERETWGITFGKECIGDTVVIEDKQVARADDSSIGDYVVHWAKNSKNYGMHLELTSEGKIQGDFICKGEDSILSIGNWLYFYFDETRFDVVDTLQKAFRVFGVKTQEEIDKIYKYVYDKSLKIDKLSEEELNLLSGQLSKALELSRVPIEPTPKPTPPVTVKKANTIKVKAKTITVKAKAVKKKKAKKKALTISKAQGKVTVGISKITLKSKKVSAKIAKKFKLNSKGYLTIGKAVNKGNYKITARIKAMGNSKYKSKTVTKTISVKVK